MTVPAAPAAPTALPAVRVEPNATAGPPSIIATFEALRTVFVMRDIEEMSVEETASQLAIRPETVKTRLHRARRLLREALA